MSYTTYYIRTTQADYPAMVALGKMLGVIEEVEGMINATNGGAWDYIGTIYTPTGEVIDGEPQVAPVCDPDGDPYIHVNLISPIDMEATAQQLAIDHPEIAGALADQAKFFVVDANGRAARPNNPARVFAS